MPTDRRLYSVGLLSCRLSDEIGRTMTNPFTGEKTAVHKDPGLSEEERRAASALLRQHGAKSEATDEYYIDFPDEASITVLINSLEDVSPVTGAEIEIVCKQLRDDHLEFILFFAATANMALVTSIMTETGQFTESIRVLSERMREVVKKRYPDAVVIESKKELRDWLETDVGNSTITEY
jgi:hypothetical protein